MLVHSDSEVSAASPETTRLLETPSALSMNSSHGVSPATIARHLSIDNLLQESVGEFGWYQRIHFFLVNLVWISEAFQTLLMVFTEKSPGWRCTAPSSHLPLPLVTCSPSADYCDLRMDQWEWINAHESTIAEFGLICGERWKAGMVGSLFFLGFLFGAGIFGALSDGILGRKKALFVCSSVVGTFGCLSSLAPSYWSYASARFMVGFGAGGLGLVAFVLGTETVGPTFRGEVGLLTQYFFSLGIMVLSMAAYAIQPWRPLTLLVSLPSLLFLILWWAVDESPRWLLVHSRTTEAESILHKIAHRNGTSMPAGAVLLAVKEGVDEGPGSDNAKGSFQEGSKRKVPRKGNPIWHIFRVRRTRWWMVATLVNWYTVSTVYYGLSLNAGHLGSNLYVNSFLNGLVEIPSYILIGVLLSRLGRRTIMSICLLLSGLCCLGSAIIQTPDWCTEESERPLPGCRLKSTLNLSLALIGKFGIAAAFNLVYVHTGEIFPTDVRNAAMGLASQGARLGGIVAPQLALLGQINHAVPFYLFSFLGILAGVLTCTLPETLNCSLFETMDDLEATQILEVKSDSIQEKHVL